MYCVTHCKQTAATKLFDHMGESMEMTKSSLNLSSPYSISENINILNFLTAQNGNEAMMISTTRRRLLYICYPAPHITYTSQKPGYMTIQPPNTHPFFSTCTRLNFLAISGEPLLLGKSTACFSSNLFLTRQTAVFWTTPLPEDK